MHFYPFNIGDYATATAHLEPLEDLAYRRLLDLYYSTEKPIPLDLNKVSRLIRMRTHSDCIAIVLDEFFTEEGDGYHCDRIDVELFKYHEKSDKASKSAKARWKKAKQKQKVKAPCERIANAEETQCDGNAKQEPINNKQETLNTPIVSRFDEFWDMYGNKVDTKKCRAKFGKLSKASVDKIFEVLPDYIASTPVKQFRKLPATWLNGECWNDEVQKTMVIETCGLDYALLVSDFNEAMANHADVPEAIKITEAQQQKLSPIANEYKMTNERFKGYFNHCATSDKFSFMIEGVGMPAQGINYFLKEETLLKGME